MKAIEKTSKKANHLVTESDFIIDKTRKTYWVIVDDFNQIMHSGFTSKKEAQKFIETAYNGYYNDCKAVKLTKIQKPNHLVTESDFVIDKSAKFYWAVADKFYNIISSGFASESEAQRYIDTAYNGLYNGCKAVQLTN